MTTDKERTVQLLRTVDSLIITVIVLVFFQSVNVAAFFWLVRKLSRAGII